MGRICSYVFVIVAELFSPLKITLPLLHAYNLSISNMILLIKSLPTYLHLPVKPFRP
jgi:hypothetical protein